MFGRVKGYNAYMVTNKTLKKKNWSFDELEEKEEKIEEKISQVLEEGGEVFALGKKKIFKAVYLFKVVNDENKKTIVFDKKIVLDEVSHCTEEFENDLSSILGQSVAEGQYSKAVFENKEIEPHSIKIGKLEISSVVIWYVLGLLLSILFNDIIWICMGFCFGLSLGYVVKINDKKIVVSKGRKYKKRTAKKKLVEEKSDK